MAIIGVGTDICKIPRIKKMMLANADTFIARILTKNERVERELTPDFLARRWAAKEAIAKALGTGIGANLSFKDIEITRVGNSAPTVVIERPEFSHVKIHLSISDDGEYATAFAIAEEV